MSIKEIAEKAGVSIGTVDRVLHKRGRVSQANIDKIMKIVKETNYTPNNLASRLSCRTSFTFGVLIPRLDSEFGYWKQIYEGFKSVEKELSTQQIDILYFHYDRQLPDSFNKAADSMFMNDISAYIVAPLLPDRMRQIAEEHPDVPYVFIDSSVPGLKPLADLSQDPEDAGRTAARMMALMGPDISKVFTLQPFSGVAFNGKMRAECFAEAYSHLSDAEVVDVHSRSISELSDVLDSYEFKEKYGLFIVNDSVHEVCDVLIEKGIIGHFIIIGFDLSPYNRIKLEEGTVHVLLGQRPYTQARDAMMLLFRRFVLGINEELQACPVDIYIRENVTMNEYWN